MTRQVGDETVVLGDCYVTETSEIPPPVVVAAAEESPTDVLWMMLQAPYAAGSAAYGEDDTVVLPIDSDFDASGEGAPYWPEDERPRGDIKAGRKNYKKAQQYYGKTYIFTQRQLVVTMVFAVGLVLALSSAMFQMWVNFVYEVGSR